MNKNLIFSTSKQKSLVSKSFIVAGISFLLIFLIGMLSWLAVSRAGALDQSTSKYDFSIYSKRNELLFKLAISSKFLIFASMFMSIVWQFRFAKASKTFIISNFVVYILAQGLGFGILFSVWNGTELLGIFAIGGTLFVTMGLVGYYSKDLSHWGKILFTATFALFFFWLFSWLLIRFGVLKLETSYSFMTIAVGVLLLGYTAYDVWRLKQTVQWQESIGGLDEDTEYRIKMFFGFRLLVDLVGIIWIIALLFKRFGR